MLNLFDCKELIPYYRDVQDKIFYLQPGFGDKKLQPLQAKIKYQCAHFAFYISFIKAYVSFCYKTSLLVESFFLIIFDHIWLQVKCFIIIKNKYIKLTFNLL